MYRPVLKIFRLRIFRDGRSADLRSGRLDRPDYDRRRVRPLLFQKMGLALAGMANDRRS